jgi:hypothetical protein
VRFSFVHIGGLRENQAASIESQAIHPIQLFFGPTLTNAASEWTRVAFSSGWKKTTGGIA